MLSRSFGPAVPFLVLAAALAGCGGGGGGAESGGLPAATVRTLVYAPTECREDETQRTWRQELRIERGEGAPVAVTDARETFMQQPPVFPGACQLAGLSHTGNSAVFAGGIQRLAVSPDGSTVVFEKTNQFSVIRAPQLAPDREGFFAVSADGSGLRPLGPPSRASVTRFALDPSAPNHLFRANSDNTLSFSADGRTVVFTDRGPGPAGEDATQIVTLDLFTGERTQRTQLPPCAECNVGFFETGGPRFLPDGTIVFYTLTNPDGLNPGNDYRIGSVKPDGSFTLTPPPVAQPGSTILPTFVITGDHPTSFDYGGPPCKEVYLLDHNDVLQLTNFCRPDTFAGTQSLDGQRAFFVASANPFKTNPSENCQIFSIDRLGTDLQQLTKFSQGEHSSFGCDFNVGFGPPGCITFAPRQDPATQALVFESSCDPFRTNPNGGQVFAMNPDGTHLRQLTDTSGFTTEADGTVDVELPGPSASTAVRR